MTWQDFVASFGGGARAHQLAHIVGRSADDIRKLRLRGVCRRRGKPLPFQDLFARWHGRPPRDDEWPAPRRIHKHGDYEWLAPEVTVLARLVGRLGTDEIAKVLTARLRRVAGDATAVRTRASVVIRANKVGLQVSRDLVGGLTVREAGAEIGSTSIVHHAIREKHLRCLRVGRRLVIPRDVWEAWKKKRVLPPKGYVVLASLRARLGISSDSKLPEAAAAGHIPTAVLCKPWGAGIHTSKRGTWFIDAKVAAKLLADRRAGRPMPWFGKLNLSNLKVTYALWRERQHPGTCEACRKIWGPKGPPRTLEEYADRYVPLEHGAKRHLTYVWSPGLTVEQVSAHCAVSRARVLRAIGNGLLSSTKTGRARYVNKTDATRWKARKCPTGDNEKSWLALSTARNRYGFSVTELRELVRSGALKSMVADAGPARGETFVLRQQCAELRARRGFTIKEAARKLRLPSGRVRALLRGIQWRGGAERIPEATISAIRRRHESAAGRTLQDAARELNRSLSWVEEQIADGAVRVSRNRWDRRRRYLTLPMMARLRACSARPDVQRRKFYRGAWLRVGEAQVLAGVSQVTVSRWAEDGHVPRRQTQIGWLYSRAGLLAQARRYWKTCRFKRDLRPGWLVAEQAA